MNEERKIKYEVLETRNETENIFTVVLKTPSGDPLSFSAGQYINVYFPETGKPEGKSYSISSPPGEKNFSLCVRTIGDFSKRLSSLSPGDKVTGTEPYGYFFSDSDDSPLVMIASGIGVSPFRSMILDQLKKNPGRPMRLFYGSCTLSGAVFGKEFETLAKKHPNFRLRYFITRENPGHPLAERGRMDGKKILSMLSFEEKGESAEKGGNGKNLNNAEFLICGSIEFTRDLWRSLQNAGAPEENIYTEAFF